MKEKLYIKSPHNPSFKTECRFKLIILNRENSNGGNPGNGKPRKKSGVTDVSITNRIQEMEERISDAEYIIQGSINSDHLCPNARTHTFIKKFY